MPGLKAATLGLLALTWLVSSASPVQATDAGIAALEALQQANDEVDIVPRYLLAGPGGRSITPEDFRGRFQLIAFGYTFCPDICPTTLVDMASVLKNLGPESKKLQAIFVTVDPERDTLEQMRQYTEFFDPRILGLTGSPALIRRTAENFRIRYQKIEDPGAAPGSYAMDHSSGLFLLGPDGQYLRKFAYGTPVERITEALRPLLQR